MAESELRRRRLLIAAAVAAVAFLAHAPSLGYGFVFDEQVLISDNPAVTDFSPRLIFAEKFWPGPARGIYYRPVVTLSYALIYAVAGPAPWLHHLLSLLSHAGASVLLYFLARRLLADSAEWPAALVGLVFAALPVHVESVAWVPGRTDVLCAGFMAAAWLALLRGRESHRRPLWLAAAAGLFLLGLGSKEVAVVLPVFLLLQDAAGGRPGKKQTTDFIVLAVMVGVFLAWRAYVLSAPGPDPAPPALEGFSVFQRSLAMAAIPGLAAVKIILPLPWRIDYAYNEVARSVTAAPLALLALALAGAGAFGIVRRRSWGPLLAGFFLTIAPVMHFVAFPNYFAERFLYLPSFFLLVALAAALREEVEDPRGLGRVVLAVVIAVMIGLSWTQGRWFKDDLTFWQAAVRQAPQLPAARNWLGIARQKRGDQAGAEREFRQALRLDPGQSMAAMNLAAAVSLQGRNDEAEKILVKLIAADPDNPDLHANLAVVYLRMGRPERAGPEVDAALRLQPDHPLARELRTRLAGP